MAKIPNGYILLSRKIIESDIWDKPPLYIKVWLFILTQAQHKPYKKLKRGQLSTSIPEIIEACSWKVGYRKEKPTKDQIFQIIDWLRKGNETVHEADTKATMITTTKATHGLLIDVDNYSFYQDPKNYESNDESDNEKATRATREQRQPDNINKNVEECKNEQLKTLSEWDSFFLNTLWPLMVRKEGKGKVSDSQKKKLYKLGDELVRACNRYAEVAKQKKKQFVQMGSTFLNSGYMDYLDSNYADTIGQTEVSREDELKAMQDKYKRMEGKQ